LCVALKLDGEDEFYLFNNDSYRFPHWKNPAWRLPRGSYGLRVTVSYEIGVAVREFRLVNHGPGRDDLQLVPL
jgi:hypothetical protein